MQQNQSSQQNRHRVQIHGPQINGILFDLDGTLLDSAPGILNALFSILEKHGVPYNDQIDLNPFIGEGLMTLVTQCAPNLSQAQYQQYTQEGFAHYIKHASTQTHAFPEAKAILSMLNQRKIPWGIVTNKTRALTQSVISALPYYDTAKVLICADDLEVKKPHPKPLLMAAEKLGTLPEHTLYLGDAINDMLAAKAANMIAVIAQYGYVPNNFKEWPHDGVVSTLLGLKKWLI